MVARPNPSKKRARAAGPGPFFFETKLRSFGTFRGRLGYAFGPVLPYVTGGWASGRNTLTLLGTFDPDVAVSLSSSETQVHTGWAIGGGLEFAFARNWSVKAEYLHLHLRAKRYNILIDDAPDVITPISEI